MGDQVFALVPIAGMLMVLGIVLGVPLVRAYSKRMESASRLPALPADLTARLERIEQGIEAMSTEIERISEGQRFTTKLLAEPRHAATPAATPAPLSASPRPSAPEAAPAPPPATPEGTVLAEAARHR